MRRIAAVLAALALTAAPPPQPVSTGRLPADDAIPRFAHVIVIVEENKSYARIIGSPDAPRITALARTFGNATAMYGEVHPSEGNYVSMIAGSNFGIHDDAAWSLPDHDLDVDALPLQLKRKGLTWRGYFGDLPAPGSLVTFTPADATHPAGLYASKHNPFVNITKLRTARDFAANTVGLERFSADLDEGRLPSCAFVVPNQCDEMHGLSAGAPNVPADCSGAAVIRRGDRVTAELVDRVVSSSIWHGRENVAIVITWDEDDGTTTGDQGCCTTEAGSVANFGGGHIPTVVLTNHGPRGVSDATPYDHYSLLRTIEDAFGIDEFLGYAGATARGVKPMVPLFAVTK